jgi:hypothetical protein
MFSTRGSSPPPKYFLCYQAILKPSSSETTFLVQYKKNPHWRFYLTLLMKNIEETYTSSLITSCSDPITLCLPSSEDETGAGRGEWNTGGREQ